MGFAFGLTFSIANSGYELKRGTPWDFSEDSGRWAISKRFQIKVSDEGSNQLFQVKGSQVKKSN